jgi:hypothetical protein
MLNNIQRWKNEYGYGKLDHDPLFIKRLRTIGLSEKQIDNILGVIDDTCNHCWDEDKGCYCIADD